MRSGQNLNAGRHSPHLSHGKGLGPCGGDAVTPGPVDDATLAAVAAAAIGAGGQVRVVDWVSRQIFAGDGRGLGVYRFDGTASHEGETVRWSAVLKVLGRSGNDDEDERGWDYWRREALAYRSGLLAQLPGGLAAPRLLHATEGVGGRQELWLEAVEEEIGPRWPLFGMAWWLGTWASSTGRLGWAAGTDRAMAGEGLAAFLGRSGPG